MLQAIRAGRRRWLRAVAAAAAVLVAGFGTYSVLVREASSATTSTTAAREEAERALVAYRGET